MGALKASSADKTCFAKPSATMFFSREIHTKEINLKDKAIDIFFFCKCYDLYFFFCGIFLQCCNLQATYISAKIRNTNNPHQEGFNNAIPSATTGEAMKYRNRGERGDSVSALHHPTESCTHSRLAPHCIRPNEHAVILISVGCGSSSSTRWGKHLT